MSEPSFPPLFTGQAVTGQIDPFDKACVEAVKGCDSGLVVHNVSHDSIRAAIVVAPDVPLEDAMVMLPMISCTSSTAGLFCLIYFPA